MNQYTAEAFRQKLAGLESPEKRLTTIETEKIKNLSVKMIRALHKVFGEGLDRKTVWERISNGIIVSSAKSGGNGSKFLAELLDYVKASPGMVASNDDLKDLTIAMASGTPEVQRHFIRTCVEYRLLLCLEVRDTIQTEKAERAATKEAE